ncbi:MAG TPA: amidohydrolase family protein [Stellaceae bacterium]|jgi:aminocarboxymuconate-semialdehyde decarboxylase|nr:amidohydrolase family protein [Stellaceae bacterium]
MIIDTHAHVVPATLLDAMRSEKRLFPSVRLHDGGPAPRMEFAAGGPGRPIQPRLHDLAQRREWLTQARVDHQLVGGWTDVYGYDLPASEGADWARFYNEHMAKDAAALPVLSALATVPLQDGALAAKVLEEALDAGFHGAMIATQPKGIGGNLDDPSLDPFWEVASARNAAIFLHPHYVCGDDRLDGYDLINAVGRLADTTIAVARLLFSGHLTRFPGVSLLLSHAGGALPYALGRLKRNKAIHRELADPEAGFRRLYFDTVLFEPLALRFLCDLVGADKIMLGSDFPFGIGDPDPRRLIEQTALTAAERDAILGGNAARIFHVECGCGASHP